MTIMAKNDKIFVSVANYRDSEINSTIASMYTAANKPSRVFAGVLTQINDETDHNCSVVASPNIRQIVVDHKESKGVCWARSRIMTTMRQDEEYVLQIDSHTRFAKGWDDRLIASLNTCPDRSVLTTYPVHYNPPNELDAQKYIRLSANINEHNYIPMQCSIAEALEDAPVIPERTAFFAGGMSFTRGETFDEVPYDPYLYFLGEEITMAVRLYTHGFNCYVPNDPVLWHRYNTSDHKPLHWRDNNKWTAIDRLSITRIQHILGIKITREPEALREIIKYGLGTKRSLKSYQVFAGYYFKTKTIEPWCINGKPLVAHG